MLAKPLGVLRLQLRTLRVRVPRTVVCLDGAVLLLENDPEGKGALALGGNRWESC